eukprot:8826342-Pyramimonas_sp.AAC.1
MRGCSKVGKAVFGMRGGMPQCHSDLTLAFEEHDMLAKYALFLVTETPLQVFTSYVQLSRSRRAGGSKRPASALQASLV